MLIKYMNIYYTLPVVCDIIKHVHNFGLVLIIC
jgi:hypothetical protein